MNCTRVMQLFSGERHAKRSQALHICVTSICVLRIVEYFPSPPVRGEWFFFISCRLTMDEYIYFYWMEFFFLYRMRWWCVGGKVGHQLCFIQKKKKKPRRIFRYRKFWGKHPKKKKESFLLFYSLNLLLNHPIFAPRGGGRARI